jgi:hypothetical protein
MASAESRKDKGATLFVAAALLLTLVGAGAGVTLGSILGLPPVAPDTDVPAKEQPAAADTTQKPDTEGHGGSHGAASPEGTGEPGPEDDAEDEVGKLDLVVVPLPPILTTLAAPAGRWVRLEGSILVDKTATEAMELLAGRAGEQILTYLRTARLDEIEGPSGFLGLREDLNEMLRILSEYQVQGVLIHGLVVE